MSPRRCNELVPSSPAKNHKTLLCIDDQVEGLLVRKGFLEVFGFKVLIASSGAEGLRILLQRAVDAVILDYHMAGMDGGLVAAEVRRLCPAVPILMLSGYAAAEIPADARAQVDCHVRKGDSPDRLVTEIERLVGKAHVSPAGKNRHLNLDRRSPKRSAEFRGDRRKTL